jgi:uridine kinase
MGSISEKKCNLVTLLKIKNMTGTVKVHCLNTDEHKEIPIGTSLVDLIKEFNVKSPYLITNARVNNKTESLTYRVYRPKKVEFVDLTDSSAMRTYVRSLCFILAKAVDDIMPNAKTYLEHAVSKGYYFQIESDMPVGEHELNAIRNRMKEIVEANLPFEQVEEETEKVVELFRSLGLDDKAQLLETSDMLYARYSKLDGYIDYFYGSLTPTTGYITIFDIQPHNGGFLLRVPNRQNPVELEPEVKQEKLLNVYREHLNFLKISRLDNVGDLNRAIREDRVYEVIQVAEAYQSMQINYIAKEISKRFNDGVKVVFISGPSSSGKTTFRKRLEVQLMVNLLKPVGISLDDYFVNRDNTPLDENGEKDYESLYALDLELFEDHMLKLMSGETVELPTYNFVTGKKVNISGGGKKSLIVSVLLNESDFISLNEAVMKHYKSAETIPELAKLCGYSCAKTFSRHFIKHFNETPKQWILNMKQEEMIMLLKETTYSYERISSMLRFKNLSHFNNFCKKRTGLTPKEIRGSV